MDREVSNGKLLTCSTGYLTPPAPPELPPLVATVIITLDLWLGKSIIIPAVFRGHIGATYIYQQVLFARLNTGSWRTS
jgi:hypothetical protein